MEPILRSNDTRINDVKQFHGMECGVRASAYRRIDHLEVEDEEEEERALMG
jgi:hypothetical protein